MFATMNLMFEPFKNSFQEIKTNWQLCKNEALKRGDKAKVLSLVYFNVLFLFIYSILILFTIYIILVGAIIQPLGFLALISTIPGIAFAIFISKRAYPKLKMNYLKGIKQIK
ncbi:hypothetical protein [Halobacillus hunanensis]|uniref:hypothetical protein n=1 Tax=Halobacillus hunanensis TaxID=578214 RepID=UPI0011178259|nr:hypothetical protein [Halobacillus hunanensis]